MGKSYKNYLKLSNILKFSSLNYLQGLLSFAASSLLARSIGKELYGEYALGLICFNILSTINQFGSDKTLIKDLVHEEEPQSVLKAATFINIVVSLLTLSGVCLWLVFQEVNGNSAVIVILFALAGTCLSLSPIAWFDYKGYIHRQAVIFTTEKLLYLIAICAIILIGNYSSITLKAALAFLACRLFSATQEWQFVLRTFDGVSTKTWFYVRKLLSSNIWIWIAVVGNMLMSQGNQLILKSGTNASQLASYTVAFQLIMLVRLFQRQLMRLMAPSIAELTNLRGNNLKAVRKKMHKYYSFSVVSSLVLVVPLFIIAPLLINTVVGPQYLDAVPIFRILLIWISLFGLAIINNQFLIGFNLNRIFFIITISFGFLSLFIAFELVPIFQGKGAALSLLISHYGSILAQVTVVEFFIRKAIKSNANQFL